jgi:RNA polymerase sigma factor (sigma-70 family)
MQESLERLYRDHAAGLMAALTRIFGPGRLDAVEAVLHDTFVSALEAWRRDGLPDNPAAWLTTVARNRAFDVRKGERRRDGGDADIEALPDDRVPDTAVTALRGEVADDELRMMFVACHPLLSLESQLALALRTLCGFEVVEIARALLADVAAIEKRLVRARQTLREAAVTFTLPERDDLDDRLGAVLRVLYLLFGEGYAAHQGEHPIREDLCREALRLLELLLHEPRMRTTEAHALQALMLLQSSRLPARTDAAGNLRSLAEQDRGRWLRPLIERGLAALAASAQGDRVSEYHLEAGIAACHAMAARFEDTAWPRIVGYYDALVALNPSPVIRLNRAIAVAYAEGPARGLEELRPLEREPRLAGYGLLGAARADLLARAGDPKRARQAYLHALDLVDTEAERRLIRRRLAEL